MFLSFVERIAPLLLLLAIAPVEPPEVVYEGPPRPIQGRPITLVRRFAKVGRNEPCPCGSGTKSKNCRH